MCCTNTGTLVALFYIIIIIKLIIHTKLVLGKILLFFFCMDEKFYLTLKYSIIRKTRLKVTNPEQTSEGKIHFFFTRKNEIKSNYMQLNL